MPRKNPENPEKQNPEKIMKILILLNKSPGSQDVRHPWSAALKSRL